MSFSFKVAKPADVKYTFGKFQEELAAYNGKLVGDESKGVITVLGTEGRYEVFADYIQIVITKKLSPLIPDKIIEKEIRERFKAGS
ncbi:MAG: hypothetical protein FWE05_00315 [Defluviitaleaceae bacterium]|nr:hypothetical protein [Defluviitaleaceae bacterium]